MQKNVHKKYLQNQIEEDKRLIRCGKKGHFSFSEIEFAEARGRVSAYESALAHFELLIQAEEDKTLKDIKNKLEKAISASQKYLETNLKEYQRMEEEGRFDGLQDAYQLLTSKRFQEQERA